MPDRALIEQLDQAIDGMLAGSEQTGSADPTLSALMEIAGTLRDLPDDRFKTRLSRELQAESAAAEFAAIHTITPFICVPEGAKLIEFMKHTFGAEETTRHPHGPDGFVAGVRIGDSDLLIMGGESLRGAECPAALHVYVKDCDATYQRALDAGAFTIRSPGVGDGGDERSGGRKVASVRFLSAHGRRRCRVSSRPGRGRHFNLAACRPILWRSPGHHGGSRRKSMVRGEAHRSWLSGFMRNQNTA